MVDGPDPASQQSLRTMQIITFALVMGLVMFTAVTVALTVSGVFPVLALKIPLFTYGAIAMLVIAVVFSIAVPRFIVRLAIRKLAARQPVARVLANQSVERQLLATWQTSSIIGLACLEWVGFFAGIAFLLERRWEGFAVIVAVVLLMLARFPTRKSLDSWLAVQADAIELARRDSSA